MLIETEKDDNKVFNDLPLFDILICSLILLNFSFGLKNISSL
jgi:hypothetical protein